MQLPFADAVRYALFTITVTASCVQAEPEHTQDVAIRTNSRIAKRETTLLIDNYPVESRIKQPKVIFRRLSRYPPYKKIKQPGYHAQGQGPLNSKNFLKNRLNYKPSHVSNKKKHAPQKSRFTSKPSKTYPKGRSKPHHIKVSKDIYKVPLKHNTKAQRQETLFREESPYREETPSRVTERHPYRTTEPTGFGEPPVHLVRNPHRPSVNVDPLVDSYGIPINKKATPNAVDTGFGHNLMADEEESKSIDYDHNYKNNYKIWHNSEDPSPAFSKNHLSFMTIGKTEDDVSTYQNDDSPNIYYYNKINKIKGKIPHSLHFPKLTKPDNYYQSHFSKDKDIPNYSNGAGILDHGDDADDEEQHLVVGGKYAEPPARYVPKYLQQTLFDDEYDNFGNKGFEPEASHVSSYVNYKNSNMAFSPQNLNDAFGTVMDS